MLGTNADFRRLWTAQTISQVGTQVSALAVPLVAAVSLHASALSVSALTALQYLPYLLIGLPAGVWVDRLPRRPIMIITDLIRSFALFAVPAAAADRALTLPLLYGVVFTVGTATVFSEVANQAYLPALIGREQLIEANSKLTATRSISYAAGPTGGGWIVAVLSAPYAIIVDAVSYLGSAALVMAIRKREPERSAAAERSMRHEISEGLRIVWSDRLLATMTLYSATTSLCVVMSGAVEILFLLRTVHVPTVGIGILLGVTSLGAVAGAFVAGPICRRVGDLRSLVTFSIAASLGMLLAPLTALGPRLAFFVGGLGLTMCAIVAYNVVSGALVQRRCPDRLIGRIFATTRFIAWSTPPVGALIGGLVGDTIGLRAAMWLAGALFAASAAFFAWSLRHGAPIGPLGADPTDMVPTNGMVPANEMVPTNDMVATNDIVQLNDRATRSSE